MKGNEDVQTWRWESMMSVDVVVVGGVGVGGWVDMRKKKARARAIPTKGVEDEKVARCGEVIAHKDEGRYGGEEQDGCEQ